MTSDSELKLFETNLPKEELHPSFKDLCDIPLYQPVKAVIQAWSKGLSYRKNEKKKFIYEFQTTFNSTFWELYLNKLFIALNYKVDYNKERPDFCVKTPKGYSFNVEAVVSDNPRRESNLSLTHEEFRNRCTEKLLGKIKDKRDLFIGYGNKRGYSSLAYVKGKPFVIAIAPFDSDISLTQNNEIINRVLFGLDTPDFLTGDQKKIFSIKKTSGTELNLGIFTNDTYREISAVIFSTTGTFGKAVVEAGIDGFIRATRYRRGKRKHPISSSKEGYFISLKQISQFHYTLEKRVRYKKEVGGDDTYVCLTKDHHETHFDGLHIYYNPYADIPLDKNIFYPKEITHNFYDIEKDEFIFEHPDRALVSRQFGNYSPEIFDLFLSHLKLKMTLYKKLIR